MLPQPLNAPRQRTRAFSLIEVVLALGVVSFSLIGIFGLLLSGMTTFHRSIDQTVQSQIAQQVINNAQLTSYATLTSQGNFTTNYDENGNGVAATDPTSIYTVSVSLTNLATSLTASIPPTAGTNLVMQIWNKTSPSSTNIYSTVLVNDN